MNPNMVDQETTDAFRVHDRTSENQLYEQLQAVARRAIKSRAFAWNLPVDDLVQLTLERVHRTLTDGTFCGHCSLNSWVHSIARHAVIDACRSAKRERLALREYAHRHCDQAVDQQTVLESRGELRAVSSRLGRMKTEYANVVLAAGIMDVSLADVANQSQSTVAATATRLRRGRESLRRGSELDRKRGDAPAQIA